MNRKKAPVTMGFLSRERDIRLLFLLCWTVYCVSYIGRLNYSSAMTKMIAKQAVSASEAGFISMLYFFAYGTGQMVNGFLGDYVNPKRMIFLGLFFSGMANMLMGVCHGFLPMACVWGINGYFQAMIWAPIIRIFAEMLDEKHKVNCSVNIVTSQIIGTLLAYLMSAGILAFFPWQRVFGAAAVLLTVTAFLWETGFSRLCRRSMKQEREGRKAAEAMENPEEPERGDRMSFPSMLLASGMAVLLFPVIVHGMLKDGVTSWVPTYISEVFAVSPSFSVLLTTVLPLINLTGAYGARYIYKKVEKSIAKSVGVFFAAAEAALLFLYGAGRLSPVLSVLFLAVITASMMAVNTLVVNLYPLRFQKYGRVSGVSGFLNALAYLGTAVSTYAIGILVQFKGWQAAILSWVLTTGAAGVLCLGAVLAEKRRKL